jgi:hypothetical protein
MGVQVDDAGHQAQPAGVDHFDGVAADLADRGNPRILDRDIGASGFAPLPIDNRSSTDHQIVHIGPPPATSRARRYDR